MATRTRRLAEPRAPSPAPLGSSGTGERTPGSKQPSRAAAATRPGCGLGGTTGAEERLEAGWDQRPLSSRCLVFSPSSPARLDSRRRLSAAGEARVNLERGPGMRAPPPAPIVPPRRPARTLRSNRPGETLPGEPRSGPSPPRADPQWPRPTGAGVRHPGVNAAELPRSLRGGSSCIREAPTHHERHHELSKSSSLPAPHPSPEVRLFGFRVYRPAGHR